MVHVPGVKNRPPDALSRHPTGDHSPPKTVLHTLMTYTVSKMVLPSLPSTFLLNSWLASAQTTSYLVSKWNNNYRNRLSPPYTPHIPSCNQPAMSSDENMLLLLSTIEDGIPELKHQLPPPAEYHQFRKH